MARVAASEYVCQTCATAVPRWEGRCRTCGAWNSLVETLTADRPTSRRRPAAIEPPRSLAELEREPVEREPVGLTEVDRLLGGGIVPGSLLLLGGEPGIGKSTLVLQIAASVTARPGHRDVLYASAEESASQLQLRAQRLGILEGPAATGLRVLAATDVDAIISAADELRPALLIVDSISTIELAELDGPPGSVGQVRESAARLGAFARGADVPVLLVGHVTKDGSIAGPRTLEHVVDAVLMLEGDRDASLRLLRSLKNRHGATDEVGVLAMTAAGIDEIADATTAFLERRRQAAAGVAVTAVLEGSRPLLVEAQALVAPAAGPPRRTVSGVDANRVALLAAVLARRGGIDVSGRDVYVTLAGGLTASEPALDLAIALAIASSRRDAPIAGDLLVLGELSLLGELRPVRGLDRRLREGARRGFRRALVPAGPRALASDGKADEDPGIELLTAGTIAEALRLAFDTDGGTSG